MRILVSMLLAGAALWGAPTWNEVRPVLEKRCVQCHQDGEIAPMAFTSYAATRPFAKAMRQAVLRGTMPPWHAAEGKLAWRNDRALPAEEKALLTAWVEAGAPAGADPKDIETVEREEGAWKLGKPDRIVKVPGFTVPRDGVLPYSFLIQSLHFDRDTWVRAAEFRIDQRGVIHHINAFIRPPGSSYLAGFPKDEIFTPSVSERGKRREGEKVFERRQLLLGYEPGYEPMPWLENGAKLIPAGSDVIFEMHYNPNGTGVTDYSEFGLYIADAPPAHRILAIDTLRDLDLTIPPQAADYVSHASMTLARPARLLAVQPHMHLRGKSMAVKAIYPDGRSETVLNVPRYDFNWQTTYVLAKPLELPAGTRLESAAGFDNSPNNKFNPNPAATVRWGDQTADEMHIAFLELVIEADGDAEKLFAAPPKMVGTPTAQR